MFINKVGHYHLQNGLNCQDYGFINKNKKCVLDGCSEGIHSEVGVKLFAHLYSSGFPVNRAFNMIIDSMGFSHTDIKNYMCFTILSVTEDDIQFNIQHCGDGFIIKQHHDNGIEFEKLDDGEFPKYYAYNFVDTERLTHYKDGVSISEVQLPKSKYKNVGVASDGLRYIFGSDFEDEFIEYLANRKESSLKRLINKEIKTFKDDITLVL